jgi:hypothetical protein
MLRCTLIPARARFSEAHGDEKFVDSYRMRIEQRLNAVIAEDYFHWCQTPREDCGRPE